MIRRALALVAAAALLWPTQALAAAARSISLPGAPLAAPAAAAAVALPALPALPATPSAALAAPAVPQVGTRLSPGLSSAQAVDRPVAAALPVLQQTASKAGAAQAGSSEARAALDARFDLSAPKGAGASGAPAVQAAAPTSSGPSGLSPAGGAPSPRRPEPPRGPSQRGAVNVKLLAIIGSIVAVVAAIAITLGVMAHNGHKQDEAWKSSKASADVVAVEKARRAGDANQLFSIAAAARQRQAGDADKKQAAFDGLAAARAELAANEVSKDASRRLGGEQPGEWRARLDRLDAEAKAAGHEGAVLRELDKLGAEVTRERDADAKLQADLKAFDGTLPTIGGGLLKEQANAARGQLSAFERSELQAESGMQAAEYGAARQRVSDRLMSGSQEFREHAQRRDALAAVESGTLKSAVELSQTIDDNLRDMSAKLASRTAHLKEAQRWDDEAKRLASVEVKVPAKDAQGNIMHDANGNILYTVRVEDQSGPARDNEKKELDAARADADQARGLAVSAGASAKALRPLVRLLREDGTLRRENLDSAVPGGVPPVSVYIDYSWYDLSASDLDFFLNQLTEQQANEVRARFGGVLQPLKKLQGDVESRRAGEAGWVDKRVDDQLTREKNQDF